jgi:hypothetical protein
VAKSFCGEKSQKWRPTSCIPDTYSKTRFWAAESKSQLVSDERKGEEAWGGVRSSDVIVTPDRLDPPAAGRNHCVARRRHFANERSE